MRFSALRDRLAAALAEFRTPSPRNPDPHHRAATGFWHFGLGIPVGALVWVAGPMSAMIAVGMGYFLVKELRDIKEGGRVADGVEDALFVAMGAAAGAMVPEAAFVSLPAHTAALIVMLAQTKPLS
ncbi:MAG: hypothetical protein KI788_14150 [Mameliella sp.]|nr:hypothetical protein [Mameliella sp.]